MSLITFENVAVIGSNGAIGRALVDAFSQVSGIKNIHSVSRGNKGSGSSIHKAIQDYTEDELAAVAAQIAPHSLDAVCVTTGILHNDHVRPEKSLKDLTRSNFLEVYSANTIVPALVAKHFMGKLRKDRKSVFFALSARVGSISDNHLGGWYAYRASKAALNMIIKNLAIEVNRTNKQVIAVGLHPGTVDSALSKPFQAHIAPEKLFNPVRAAGQLLDVVKNLDSQDSGSCLAWDGTKIEP